MRLIWNIMKTVIFGTGAYVWAKAIYETATE